MARLSWWGVGGDAEFLVEPEGGSDVAAVLAWAKHEGHPIHVLGGGANVLISDGGLPGVTLLVRRTMSWVERQGSELRAGAGTPLPSLADRAGKWGIDGFSFLCAIPGTVGGAVTMNAGSGDGDTAGVLLSATLVDRAGFVRELERATLELGYRESRIQHEFGVVVEARFRADSFCDPRQEKARQRELRARRAVRFPMAVRTTGSVFRGLAERSGPERSPGFWIDRAGLKGLRVGGAVVSHRHANVIENDRGATAVDIRELMRLVRDEVESRFGICLVPEVRLLPEESPQP